VRWRTTDRGSSACAACASHAELDEAEDLDDGDPDDLGRRHAALRGTLPHVTILGGCCGTDIRHVTSICDAWLGAERGSGE
jgi:homocysteine S-methyltransferase